MPPAAGAGATQSGWASPNRRAGQHGRTPCRPLRPLIDLLTAFVLALLVLLLLRQLAALALRLVVQWLDPAVERVRTANQQERIQRILAATLTARQRARMAAEARGRSVRLVDLNGRSFSLSPDRIPAFHSRCCQELGVPAGSSWPLIRRQWRRQSLRWHPDQGGDTATWLRKLRAYEALQLLQSHRRDAPLPPPPPLLAARRGWRWWR